MTQNLITSAFELVRDVEHGVLLLDTFHRLSAREVGLPTSFLPPPLVHLSFPSRLPGPSRCCPTSICALAHALNCQRFFSSSVPAHPLPLCLEGLRAGLPWQEVSFLPGWGAAGTPYPWSCHLLPLLRQAIKRTYDKKAVDLYMLFNSELALVNRELNKKWPYLEPYMAQYSGQAHWVRILRRRIDRVMNVSLAFPGTCSRCHDRVCRLSPRLVGGSPAGQSRASPWRGFLT